MSNYEKKLKTKSDEELLTMIHTLPGKQLVLNIIIILIFCGYLLLSFSSALGGTSMPIVALFIIALIIMLILNSCPNNARFLVAVEIVNRSNNKLSSNNAYDYVIYEETKRYGAYRYKQSEENLYKLNKVFRVFAVIVYIFFIGVLLLTSILFGLLIFIICTLISVVIRTEAFHRIKNLSFVPTKFLWALFGSSFQKTPNYDFSNINKGNVKSEGTATNPKEMGKELSLLRLRNEVKLNYYSIPNAMRWNKNLNLTVIDNKIEVTGELVYKSNESTAEYNLRNTVEQLERDIRRDLEKQVDIYYSRYPNAPTDVEINIEIEYRVEAE